MGELTRRCKHCFGAIPDARPRSKYCKDGCRTMYAEKTRKRHERGSVGNLTPPHVVKIKQLAFNNDESEMANLVREVFKDVVRNEMSAHIRDNLLGMTEVFVDMAPNAVAALKEDLTSEDDYVRSRAYALWFKYVFPMQQKLEADTESAGQMTVTINAPFTKRLAEVQQDRDTEVVDTTDWLECYMCHQTRHPDAMRRHERDTPTKDGRHICMTCHAKKTYANGTADPTRYGRDDGLFS